MRVGTVTYATSQGIAHIAKSFYDAGVITDVMVYQHPHGEERAPTHMEWYPPGTHKICTRAIYGHTIERFLDDIDIMLFIETPFDWSFANRCRERGVKTAIIPMYEWFLQHPAHEFDLFINPSLLDQQYFPHGTYIPIPVENHITWRPRHVAKRFLHNAGHIGSRNHKGTLELLKAVDFINSPIELTIRCQDKAGLKRLIEHSGITDLSRVIFIDQEVPRDQLFDPYYDVYVAPEKYNGLSLPLQEAFASGMPVMTSNRFPHNQWLPTEILIPVSGTRKAQTQRGHLEFEESIIDPMDIAMKIDEIYNQSIEAYSLEGKKYRENSTWEVLKPLYLKALEGAL